MLKVSHVKVHDIEAAIRGMRNSYKSWDKCDSNFSTDPVWIGAADKKLMLDLICAGTSHSKFQRVISTSLDVTGGTSSQLMVLALRACPRPICTRS